MIENKLKIKVKKLRSKGKTYSEIKKSLKIRLPKSTLSEWCKDVVLPPDYEQKIKELNRISLNKARNVAEKLMNEKRKNLFQNIDLKNGKILKLFKENNNVRKIVLAVLYLAEGSKTARGSLMFGNSDPSIVRIFIDLMRECYKINEAKFRCTVQCRYGQNVRNLEKFWSKITEIPPNQFYKARIDKRTIGQVSKKPDYKGVCRIDYFSSIVDLELKRIAQKMLEERN